MIQKIMMNASSRKNNLNIKSEDDCVFIYLKNAFESAGSARGSNEARGAACLHRRSTICEVPSE